MESGSGTDVRRGIFGPWPDFATLGAWGLCCLWCWVCAPPWRAGNWPCSWSGRRPRRRARPSSAGSRRSGWRPSSGSWPVSSRPSGRWRPSTRAAIWSLRRNSPCSLEPPCSGSPGCVPWSGRPRCRPLPGRASRSPSALQASHSSGSTTRPGAPSPPTPPSPRRPSSSSSPSSPMCGPWDWTWPPSHGVAMCSSER